MDKQQVVYSYKGISFSHKDSDVLVTQATTRVTLENTVLSQTQEATYCRTTSTQNVQSRQIHKVKNRSAVARGWGWGDCKLAFGFLKPD